MGAFARAMTGQAATEAANQPAIEAIQAKEIVIDNSDNSRNRQNRQNEKKRLFKRVSQSTDISKASQNDRRIDEIDGNRELAKSKADIDTLEASQADTAYGLIDTNQVKHLSNVAITKEVSGIKIPMPEHYYNGQNLTFWMSSNEQAQQEQYGDGSWIISMLLKLPSSKRAQVSKEYSTRYKAAFDAEPDDNKRTNKAALAANSWLREVAK